MMSILTRSSAHSNHIKYMVQSIDDMGFKKFSGFFAFPCQRCFEDSTMFTQDRFTPVGQNKNKYWGYLPYKTK